MSRCNTFVYWVLIIVLMGALLVQSIRLNGMNSRYDDFLHENSRKYYSLEKFCEENILLSMIGLNDVEASLSAILPLTDDRLLAVFVSGNACSSCLTSALNQIEDLNLQKDSVYIISEVDNRFIQDEVSALGFLNFVVEPRVFSAFASSETILLGRYIEERLRVVFYSPSVEPEILTLFINNTYYEREN